MYEYDLGNNQSIIIEEPINQVINGFTVGLTTGTILFVLVLCLSLIIKNFVQSLK